MQFFESGDDGDFYWVTLAQVAESAVLNLQHCPGKMQTPNYHRLLPLQLLSHHLHGPFVLLLHLHPQQWLAWAEVQSCEVRTGLLHPAHIQATTAWLARSRSGMGLILTGGQSTPKFSSSSRLKEKLCEVQLTLIQAQQYEWKQPTITGCSSSPWMKKF